MFTIVMFTFSKRDSSLFAARSTFSIFSRQKRVCREMSPGLRVRHAGAATKLARRVDHAAMLDGVSVVAVGWRGDRGRR